MPKVKELEAGNKRFSPDRLRIPDGLGLLAMDPGDVHVGIAWFAEDANGFPVCEWATEYGHDEGTDFVARQLSAGTLSAIALERFNLYEAQKDKQVGSDFPTCEQIGAVKYMVRVHNEFEAAWVNGDPFRPPHVTLYLAGADIKKPIRAQIKARGIAQVASGSVHASDAELHGWYRILRGEDA